MRTQIARMVAQRRRALAGLVGRDDPLWGLALSGGGIRSATFCLGLVKSLAREGLLLRFDLLSTVSGGGFIGAMLGRLFQDVRHAADSVALQAALARAETLAFGDWLRRHGRYLIPRGATDLRYAAAVMLRNLLGVHAELGFLALVAGCVLALGNLLIWGVMEHVGLSDALPEALAGVAWLTGATATAWLVLPLAGMFFVIAGCAYWASQPFSWAIWRKQFAFWLAWALALYLLLGGSDLALPTQTDRPLFGAWLVALVIVLAWLAAFPYLWGVWLWGTTDPARVRQRLSGEASQLLQIAMLLLALGGFDRLAWWLAFEAHLSVPPAAVLMVLAAALRGLLPYLGNSSGGNGQWARRGLMLANLLGLVLAFILAAWWASLVYRLVLGELFLRYALQWGVAMGNLVLVMAPLAVYALATGSHVEFLNLSSLHPFYRARLVRSYLGAGNPERFGPAGPLGPVGSLRDVQDAGHKRIDDVLDGDDLPLQAYAPYRHGGPVHLINVCVNQTQGSPEGGRRDFNVDRRGQLLTIAPHRWCRLGGARWTRLDPAAAMSLGTWTAISAAAFSPGLGSMTRSGLATLAMFTGVRLGYWWSMGRAPVPSLLQRSRQLFDKSARMLNETLGRFRIEAGRPLFLTDGGHFENTGAYALLRERARLVVLADCGADPTYAFPDLENLVRKARIDLQVVIDFVRPRADAPALLRQTFGALGDLASPSSQCCFALATLAYMDTGETGWLVLVKPNMFQGLPVDLENFKVAHPEFPQQATTDQFFDESQWESYRRLGEEIGSRLTAPLLRLLLASGAASVERDDGGLAAAQGRSDAAAGARLATRVSQRLASATVGQSLGIGAALAAVGVPVWQGVEAYRTALQAEDQADRAALKEISERWGKLPATAPAGAASAAAVPAALTELAAALVRTQDILCPRGEGEWFRRSVLAREALTGTLRECKALAPDARSPACQTLVSQEAGNCLIGAELPRQPQCPPAYWGRDWRAISEQHRRQRPQAADAASQPARDDVNGPLCDTAAEVGAEWQVVRARVTDMLTDSWTGQLHAWLLGQTSALFRRTSGGNSSPPGATAGNPPPQTTPAPQPASAAAVPAPQVVDRTPPSSPYPPPAPERAAPEATGACTRYTVYLQIYGPQARASLAQLADVWRSHPDVAAKVPGLEDVYASADRAARRRPVPYGETTVLYRADDSDALACISQLKAAVNLAHVAGVPQPGTWAVRPFPASLQAPHRVIEVWYVQTPKAASADAGPAAARQP